MGVDGAREGQDLFVDSRKENLLVEACLGWSEHGATCESPCERCIVQMLVLRSGKLKAPVITVQAMMTSRTARGKREENWGALREFGMLSALWSCTQI